MRACLQVAALTAASLLALSCGDDPSPVDPDVGGGDGGGVVGHGVYVQPSPGFTYVAAEPEPASIRCNFDLTFHVGDAADAPIRPRRLVFRVVLGAHPTQPVDSLVLEAAELAEFLGTTMERGAELPTRWTFTSVVPFGLRGAFEFRDDSYRAQSAAFTLDCGPIPETSDTVPPPVITDVRVTPASGTVEAGDPVIVEYDVTSQFGLWETMVIVEGQTGADTLFFNDALATHASRSFEVRHPPADPLGSRLSVHVVAMDATTRLVAASPVLSAALTDTRGPTGASVQIRHPHCTPICQFYPGEHLHVEWTANDPSGLGRAYFEFGEPVAHADSTGAGLGGIEAPPRPLGVVPLRARVSDRFGNDTTLIWGDVNVFVVDTPTSRTRLIPVDSRVHADFPGARVWVDAGDGALSSFAMTDLGATGTVALQAAPGAIDFGANTLVAALADSPALEILRRDGGGARTIPIGTPDGTTGWRTGNVVLTATGTVLVALARGTGADARGYVVAVDTADGSQSILAGPSSAHFRLSRSGDGSRAMLFDQCGRIYDATSGALGECRTVVGIGLADRTGSSWIASCVIYDIALLPIGEVADCGGGTNVPSPAGDETYWQSSTDYSSGLTHRTHAGLVLSQGMIDLPWGAMSLDPDGRWSVAAGATGIEGEWRVTIVDLE